MARCSTVSFGVSSPTEVVETSVSIARSSWAGTPAGHGIGADPLRVGCSMVGAGYGVPYLARRLHLREPGCCWLSAGEAEATARSVMDSVGMLGAHGGRAAWSSARRLGVRTLPARVTSTVIS
jgi:hypothetical protein